MRGVVVFPRVNGGGDDHRDMAAEERFAVDEIGVDAIGGGNPGRYNGVVEAAPFVAIDDEDGIGQLGPWVAAR
jgi:hypothetical protein